MRRVASAIAGGFAGTAVLSLLLLLLEGETRSVLGVFDSIARYVGVPGNQALGFVLFVLAGTLAWPLVFLAVQKVSGECVAEAACREATNGERSEP